jgi:hypothetical protein
MAKKKKTGWLLGAFAVVSATVVLLANVGGAWTTVQGAFGWFKERNEKEVYLTLVNLDAKAGLMEGGGQTSGVNLITVQAIIRNDGEKPVWALVSKADANLGKDECVKDAVVWQTVPIPPRMSVELNACNIDTKLLPGDRRDGRIDLAVRYGAKENVLDKTLNVKGSVAVTALEKNGRLTWVPDGDSAKPVGMIPKMAVVSEGEAISDAVQNDAARR